MEHAAQELERGSHTVRKFGTMWFSWSRKGLVSLSFRPPEGRVDAAGVLPERFRRSLDEYFKNGLSSLSSLPIDLRGTDFQLKVWHALLGIPIGEVRSYGSIAEEIGSPRGMRAVGTANGKNPLPIVVPCHRVIEKGGRLGGYSGGQRLKQKLLELEGASVDAGRVYPGQLLLPTAQRRQD